MMVPGGQTDCVQRILARDSILGEVRNHATETTSVSKTVLDYTRELDSLDYSNCPEEFKKAFHEHINAWLNVRSVTDKYPHLRGEMHDVFNEIEKTSDSVRFKQLVGKIWETWARVEKAAN
ncbi:MAG: hypothetical protein KJO51_08200 [Gramella sp.]|nr:hypothetical protein [Christiangramia sp.]